MCKCANVQMLDKCANVQMCKLLPLFAVFLGNEVV